MDDLALASGDDCTSERRVEITVTQLFDFSIQQQGNLLAAHLPEELSQKKIFLG